MGGPDLSRYVARTALSWQGPPARLVDGSYGFFDITGFTTLSERLERLGPVGAELTTAAINAVFQPMIGRVLEAGGDVLEFGGDAIFALFEGDCHQHRAAWCAARLQQALAEHGRVETPSGAVRLRMSGGLHTGEAALVLADARHQDLLAAGPGITRTAQLEKAATAGQILVSRELAAALPPTWCGPGDEQRLLRLGVVNRTGCPPAPTYPATAIEVGRLLSEPLRRALPGPAHGEHRPVAMAFVTLPGTDGVLAAGGLPALTTRLDEIVRLIDDVCDQFGVCLLESDVGIDEVRFKLTAGAPGLSERDDERMLLTVRALADAGADLRIGANHGRVFAGEVGHPLRATFTVMGDAMNVAARLMAQAEPDLPLVTRSLVERSATRFAFEALTPLTVRNRKMSVYAGRLGARLGAALDAGAELPLAGRVAEMTELLGAATRGGAVEIIGEAGTGKSRLLAELRDRLGADRTWIVAAGDPYATASPYGAYHGLVEHSVEAAGDVDPTVRRIRTHALVTDLLERRGPHLAIVAEDLHWFDDASLALTRHLAGIASERGWFVVATHRPGSPGLELSTATVMDLEALSDDAVAELANAAAGQQALAPSTVRRLVRLAHGNALFARELAANAADGGSLPETIEQLVGEQVDALDRDERSLLRDAAVGGLSTPLEVIAVAADRPDARTPSRWRALRPFVAVAGGQVRFHHDLLRTAVYAGLSFRRRRELHRRFGDVLAAASVPDAAILARHYDAAGEPAASWRWSQEAAARARTAGAWVEAAELYQQALTAAGQLQTLSAGAVAAVAESLGDVAERLGRGDDANAAYRRAIRATDRSDALRAGRLLRKQGRVDERAGRYTTSLRRYTAALQALDGAAESEGLHSERAAIELGRSLTRFFQGRLSDAIELAELGLTEAIAAHDIRAQAQAYLQLEMACSEAQRPERAKYGERALVRFAQLDDDLGMGNLLVNLGVSAYNESDWEEALHRYEAAAAAYHRAGDVLGEATVINNQAEILTDQGRWTEAATKLREARRISQSTGYEFGVVATASGLARLAVREGRTDDALELLAEARAGCIDLGMQSFAIDTDVRRVEALAFGHREREALALDAETEPKLAEFGDLAFLPVTLQRLRAVALTRLGQLDEATEVLAQALETAREGDLAFEVAQVLWTWEAVGRAGGVPPPVGAAAERTAILQRLDVTQLASVQP